MPSTFNAKTYLLLKRDPAMAALSFLLELKADYERQMAEMCEKMQREMRVKMQEMQNEITGVSFKGDTGETPKAGEDYPTFEQIQSFIDDIKPKKGEHYFTPQEIAEITATVQSRIVVSQPKDGRTPKVGIDFPSYSEIERMVQLQISKLPQFNENEFLGRIKRTYPKIEFKGKDVVELVNGLPIEARFQIDASHIKNLPRMTTRPRQISGAGKGAGLGTAALLTISGTINDTNTAFTATEEPAVLLINGGMYRKTGGAITWTYSAGAIALSQAVGTNGAIYGIR